MVYSEDVKLSSFLKEKKQLKKFEKSTFVHVLQLHAFALALKIHIL